MSQQLLVPVVPPKPVHDLKADSDPISSLSSTAPDDGLRAGLDRFLSYLDDFRGCSPLTLIAYRKVTRGTRSTPGRGTTTWRGIGRRRSSTGSRPTTSTTRGTNW